MHIYGLKTCDTCRKARKALPEAEFVDVRVDGLPETLLLRALSEFGDALVNKKSTTWRGLDETARAEASAALLAQYPTLMKRPLIVDETQMTIGWTSDIATKWT